MGKANFTSVDEYISAQPQTAQVVLQLVRRTLRKALPGAEEVISYRIPAYRLHGGIVLYFAGWKQHYSLYPAGERMIALFKDQLASYKVSKGHNPFSTLRAGPCEVDRTHREVPRGGSRPREKANLPALRKR